MTFVSVILTAVVLLQQLATLPPQATAAATQGTAELSGRLIDTATGQPISGATVRLSLMGTVPSPPRSETTDEAGHFLFKLLPAGQYNLSVTRGGAVTSAFGAPTPRRITPTLTDGAKVVLPPLQVPTGVAIVGQILDEHGNPLKGATVSAWRTRYLSPGERRLDFAGQATSDETGDYRIAGLRPGTYFVDAKAFESIAPTFFPATASAMMAAPIIVTGDVGATISVRLLSIPLARVSGNIVSAQGLPSADFYVMLAPLRADGAQVSSLSMASEVDAAGKFAVNRVPPGNYNIEVVAKARLEAIGATGRSAVGIETAESGSIPVTVDGRDIDDVFIRTGPPTLVSGKVTLDGVPITAELATRMMLRTTGNSGPGGMSSVLNASSASPGADGTFRIPVIPGGRLLRVTDLPPGTVLKRVLVNGVDVTDEGFDVGGSAIGNVVIELTSKPAGLSGQIHNDRGVPQSGVGVIVFSEDPRRWRLVQTRVVVATRTKADGTFSFVGLPAGNYIAAVVPVLVDGEWAEPSNLEKLRATATAFKLGDGEVKTLSLVVR